MHLAIFNVFPLQIVGILEINKKVGAFVVGYCYARGSDVLLYICKFCKMNAQKSKVNLILSDIWKWRD